MKGLLTFYVILQRICIFTMALRNVTLAFSPSVMGIENEALIWSVGWVIDKVYPAGLPLPYCLVWGLL